MELLSDILFCLLFGAIMGVLQRNFFKVFVIVAIIFTLLGVSCFFIPTTPDPNQTATVQPVWAWLLGAISYWVGMAIGYRFKFKKRDEVEE